MRVGVVAEMQRSRIFFNLVSLINAGAITEKDLDGFSGELSEVVKYLVAAE